MTVDELIASLLQAPSDAEVKLGDPDKPGWGYDVSAVEVKGTCEDPKQYLLIR